MITIRKNKQIAQNRLHLEHSARIKHNPKFDQRSFLAELALMLAGGAQ